MGTYSLASIEILPEKECAENILKGQPVYFDASGFLRVARANQWISSQVVGMAIADTSTGFSCQFKSDGIFFLPDWTNIAGAASLTAGTHFFLSSSQPGQLISAATGLSNNFVVPIGRAISTNSINLNFQRLIKL